MVSCFNFLCLSASLDLSTEKSDRLSLTCRLIIKLNRDAFKLLNITSLKRRTFFCLRASVPY